MTCRKLLALMLCIVSLTGGGCTGSKGLSTKDNSPNVNPVRTAKAGQEPTLTMFDNKTGRRKTIKLEDYIAGVVAAEMDPSWPAEALAAQAILARTFTLEALESKGGTRELHGTDVSTKVEEFQAYDQSRINSNVRQAVRSTRGKVLTDQGQLVKAWFSAYAGPTTAQAKEGLNYQGSEPPYIKSVESPGQESAPAQDKAWSAAFTRSELEEALGELGFKAGSDSEIQVTERGPSGRAITMRVFGTDCPGADLRVALGSTRLKSILIDDIKMDGEQIVFSGTGYGHGVGMCQWGAYALAKEGKKPEEIVSYFFEGVEIEDWYK